MHAGEVGEELAVLKEKLQPLMLSYKREKGRVDESHDDFIICRMHMTMTCVHT